jgi:hypothetical protein
LANLVGQLSRALAAFHTDLHDRMDRIVLVVMSEFGRRLRSNKSNGTDHGHAGLTIVSAPRITGGRIHGTWPGLSSDRLDNAVDLAMTTDVRSILAELMMGRSRRRRRSPMCSRGSCRRRSGCLRNVPALAPQVDHQQSPTFIADGKPIAVG